MHPFGMYLAITDSQREHGWVAADARRAAFAPSRRHADHRARTRIPDRTPGRDGAAARLADGGRLTRSRERCVRRYSRALPEGTAGRMIGAVPRRVSSPIFVGRVAERAALSEALERAAAGQPGIVLISGEAGVGKSRLLTELTTLAAGDGGHRGRRAVRGCGRGDASPSRPSSISSVTSTAPVSRRRCPRRRVPSSAVSFPRSRRQRGDRSDARPGWPGEAVRGRSRPAGGRVDVEADPRNDRRPALGRRVDARSRHVSRAVDAGGALPARRDRPARHASSAASPPGDRRRARAPADVRTDRPWRASIEGELVQQLTGILGRVPDPGWRARCSSARTGMRSSPRSSSRRAPPWRAVARVAPRGAGRAPGGARRGDAGDRAGGGGRRASGQPRAARAGRRDAVAGADRRAPRGRRPAACSCTSQDPAPGYAFRHALVREAAYDELLATERIAIHRAIADALERDEALVAGRRAGPDGRDRLSRDGCQRPVHGRSRRRSPPWRSPRQASAHAEAEVHLDRILDIWPRVPDAATAGGHGPCRPAGSDGPRRSLRGASVPRGRARPGCAGRARPERHGSPGRDPPRALRLRVGGGGHRDRGAASSSRPCRCCVTSDPPRSAQAFAAEALLRWHQGRYATRA